MIGIVDYGMGNLFSVSKALERLGADYFISANKKDLLQADALILPGVGSFRDAMERLPVETIKEFVATGSRFSAFVLECSYCLSKVRKMVQRKG